MHAEMFLREFAPLASGPGGVQKLREMVLQLAVRGKLVPQLAGDDDAKTILMGIENEPDPAIKKRIAKYPTPDPLYQIPINWVWTAIGKVSRDWGQKVPDKPFQYIDVGGIDNRKGEISPNLELTLPENAPSRARKIISRGTVLYSTVRPYLRNIAVVDREFETEAIASTAFAIVHPLGGIIPEFVFCYLRSPDFVTYVEGQMMGVAYPAINDGKFFAAPIPLPPLAEQKRIVAKVDELMALCDALAARQGEETRLKRSVAASALHHLTEDKTPEKTVDRWSLVAPCFGDLFDDLETIKGLRSAIRVLGVQGKLGTQLPTDEPAAVLLDQVGRLPPPARYAKRSKEQIPGSCGLSINMPTLPVPSAWEWVPLIEVARIESGHTPSRSRADWWGGDIPWMGLVDARHHHEGTINDTIQKTNPDGIENSAARVLPSGTVCFSRTASVGYVVIMGKPMATSQDFVNWVPTEAVTSEWLQLVMVAERGSIDKFSKGAVHQTIYYPAWLSMHIALPPLAEQKRIVAKVNELMLFCDGLENQVREGERLNSDLMASLAHALTETDPDGGGGVESVGLHEPASEVAMTKQVDRETPERPDTKSVLIPLITDPEAQTGPDRAPSVDTKFQEAVLVAAIVNTFFQAGGEPIGNFRLQKAVYFARRKMGEHVGEMAYLRKAAGPYNPSMKYSGGIAIAKQKNWLRQARGRFGFGHVPGPAAEEIEDWFAKYGFGDPVRWVAEHFRFKRNEEWETLATVDYAMEHLLSLGIEADAGQVLQYIRADDEWRPKIEKLRLTEMSVGTAMLEVKALFSAEGGDNSV